MQSKCRDVGDVHQGIVCFLECDFWIKFLWISKIFTKDFHPRELSSGHPVSLQSLHFVVDVYLEMRYCNKDPHPRGRCSEGLMYHTNEFHIRHVLVNKMFIFEEGHRDGMGETKNANH
jgi:hypothetical protein